ncbi:uncharacterized protein LOC119777677 isoform X1 [Cyprinodon tularosa]|uniref:uncharacterized protein LOC119777677 isoform X1 n=1 Tax=Cyprinodon tularosa TaxID=77115 RepID=UPI0018E24AEA|nr:uncharacterized protein LOC119777677 isoform X1 [Cyprinodon tularosa]
MRRSGSSTENLPSVGGKMSVDGTKILFEGFLQKRKDTLKIRWVTYWFRLQNTTLFFYTKKNGSASHLRGYYYIYTVQSVREVQRADKKPFLFEIIMTNGKRKMLAAETASLRKEWVGYLWQAMQLSSSRLLDSRDSDLEMTDERGRVNSDVSVSGCSDSVMEVQSARRLSTSSDHIYSVAGSNTSSVCLPEDEDNEEETYQNLRRPPEYNNPTEDPEISMHTSYEEQGPEYPYDVLPARKSKCEASPTETQDVVYDFPSSYRKTIQQQDAVYDVPAHLLRKKSDHSEDEQLEEGTYWRI